MARDRSSSGRLRRAAWARVASDGCLRALAVGWGAAGARGALTRAAWMATADERGVPAAFCVAAVGVVRSGRRAGVYCGVARAACDLGAHGCTGRDQARKFSIADLVARGGTVA